MVSSANLDSQKLFKSLKTFPDYSEIKTWWLAYSGGVDSQVLLHLLSQLKSQYKLDVRAVYIDHGLQKESRQWQQHCKESCLSLNIPFQSFSVYAHAARGESPEATARTARYAALSKLINKNHCLLTAQHQDDQAETLLLQLFRGAGSAGLAAMPFYAEFSAGWHVRPLLNFSQKVIMDYAQQHQLPWVEDPSNKNNKYDRNFIRNQITPLLKQRWPSIEKTISNSADLQSENKKLLEILAAEDLSKIDLENNILCIDDLKKLEEIRLRNLLRYWIRKQQFDIPSRKIMQQIIQQLLYSSEDSTPNIRWSGVEMHRYKNRIYINSVTDHNEKQIFQWDGVEPLILDSINRKLFMRCCQGKGLIKNIIGKTLKVSFRQGGEKIKPAGRDGTHSLKKLFQEAEVPPWLRPCIPLIYLDDELIAVTGHWIADAYSVSKEESGYWPEIKVLSE